MMVIPVGSDDVDPRLLSQLQLYASDGAFARVMGGFVRDVAARAADLPAYLQNRLIELRSSVSIYYYITTIVAFKNWRGYD